MKEKNEKQQKGDSLEELDNTTSELLIQYKRLLEQEQKTQGLGNEEPDRS